MASFQQINSGAYIQTTDILDAQLIYDLDIDSREFREVLVRLRTALNKVAVLLNLKDTGYYPLSEFVNGQSFFPNPALSATGTSQVATYRQVYRLVINFGSLPNTGSTSVAHGLTPTTKWSFTRIYATASDTTSFNYIPIPYASSVLADNISISVDATNVTITTGSDRTNFDTCYVVLEYIKS